MIKVIKFGAAWCGPCRLLEPTINSLKEKYNVEGSGVEIFSADIDRDFEISERYGIHNVPTVLFFKDDIVIDTLVGFKEPSDVEDKLKTLL